MGAEGFTALVGEAFQSPADDAGQDKKPEPEVHQSQLFGAIPRPLLQGPFLDQNTAKDRHDEGGCSDDAGRQQSAAQSKHNQGAGHRSSIEHGQQIRSG